MNKKITVFILYNGRIDYLQKMIYSLSKIGENNIHLIISDNSNEALNQDILVLSGIQMGYQRREKNISIWQHIASCVDECKTDYISVMHDDDIVIDNFFDVGVNILDRNNNFACYCPNAKIVRNDIVTAEALRDSNNDLIINNKSSLLEQYFSFDSDGINPFPAYIYRMQAIKYLNIENSCLGIYSDLYILCQLLDKGCIYWDRNTYFGYRLHDTNISKLNSIGDRLKLLGYIKKTNNKNLILDYRLRLILMIILANLKNIKIKKYARLVVCKILNNDPLKLINFIKYCTYKIAIKLVR